MNIESFELAQALLLSLGGGGLLVFALSSWLGKVWASRILASETRKYTQELEEIKKENSNYINALSTASSTHLESMKIYVDLKCKAVNQAWVEFLKLKKLKPLSVSFVDMIPEGNDLSKALTQTAKDEIRSDYSDHKQRMLLEPKVEELAPFLDEIQVELFYVYRKVLFRIHDYYERVITHKIKHDGSWRNDKLLLEHLPLALSETEIELFTNEKWSPNFFLTFLEKKLLLELRNCLTGERNSEKTLLQSMRNIKIVSELSVADATSSES